MTVKLLTEQHLEFLSLERGYTGSSESTLVKMPYCWKSHVATQIYLCFWCLNLREDSFEYLKHKPSNFTKYSQFLYLYLSSYCIRKTTTIYIIICTLKNAS